MGPVGIIGYGTFGRFLAKHLARHDQVLAYDTQDMAAVAAGEGVQWAPPEAVLRQPVVILAVPVQVLEGLLREIGPKIRPDALVVDVSSVKTVPVELMRKYLPESCEILATHPLFGPQSGAKGIAGLTMVTWPVRVNDERYGRMVRFLGEDLGLKVTEVAPEAHDREMAYVQALTFFLGRALGGMELPDSRLKTATYQHLLDLQRIVANDTPELFETIQQFNPYASAVRERFTQGLDELEGSLERY
ncbi:MAG: pdh [Patescibacteria group bacterium]|nr:pdh [Patescibacteria group bacterium]